MHRTSASSSHDRIGPASDSSPAATAARRLESLALFVLLLVVAMRPLLLETYESGETPITKALSLPSELTPAATAWFDLAIWLAAAATALAAALTRRAWRWTGFEAGWLLMLAGAVLSTVVTSNKRLAINCSADWLTAAALAWTLANLARRRACVGLVLAVIIASGAASAARCGMQVTVEQADTWKQYQEMKPKFWQDQNVPLDDPRVELYERRMRSAEATGFLALANSEGAWLALAGFAALSMAALRKRGFALRALLALLAAVLMSCILMTGGRGAMLAALGMLAVLAAVWRFQELLRRRWRLLLIAGWLAVVIGAVAVVGHGRAHGGLPGSSLNFRWQYWQVTREIIADHFWPGVGAGNFDRVYLAYKPIDYPEEIKDPHNFILSVLAQWGALGAAGLLVALLGASIVAAGRWGSGDDPNGEPPSKQPDGTISPRWIAAGVAGFLALRFIVQSDLLAGNESTRALLVFDLGFYGVLWCGVFAGVCWLDRVGRRDPDDDGAYRLPLAAGISAFLLANTIDFSIFEPGPLTPFAAMVGLLLAGAARPAPTRESPALDTRRDSVALGREASVACQGPARRFAPTAIAVAALTMFLIVAFLPVVRSSHWLSMARKSSLLAAITDYRTAAAADPLDPTPLMELADRCGHTGRLDDLNRAVDAINEATLRDPDRLQLYQDLAGVLEARYLAAGSASDLLGALGAARRCVEMYTTSPDYQLDLAELLVRANSGMNSPQLRDEAIQHYEQALALNDARPGTDEVRRWSRQRADEIRRRLNALRGASQPATATAP